MDFKTTTLKNNLRIISLNLPHLQTVSLGIWVKTGAAYESVNINGISHFLEHMAFKGTKTRSALQISEEIENVGGQFNAYTSREFTSFHAKMLKDDLELAVDVLADIVQNSTFPEDEMVKEKDVIVQEIKQTLDDPEDMVFDLFQATAFPNQPLGRTVLGPEESVKSFTRDTLNQYIAHNYAGENTVFCAVGNVDHDKLVQMVQNRLGKMQDKTHFDIEPQIYQGGTLTMEKDIEQAHLLLGFNGISYASESYYPLLTMSTLFGGGMSSRLFQEIREKRGLVYSVYSFNSPHTQSGIFGIYAGTSAAQVKALLPVVADEIKKICQEKVLPQELLRAKNQLKASLLMSMEKSSTVADFSARQMLLFNKLIDENEIIAKIDAINLDTIQDLAGKIFSGTPTYTVLGPKNQYPSYEELTKLLI